MTINLFIRQPFTESSEQEQKIVQSVLDLIDQMNGNPFAFNYLTGIHAENAATFKKSFEEKTGLSFTPKDFRNYRLKLLDTANAFVNIRVGLSESSAFEIAYNIFKGKKVPMFFAIWKNAPIKTTLLRDLDDLCKITYAEFDSPEELIPKLNSFFTNLNKKT